MIETCGEAASSMNIATNDGSCASAFAKLFDDDELLSSQRCW
jgi:hypothetical protein